MSALPSTTTSDEYLNEQLINCLNIQTNVIQNLAQYSQHISLQLIEIKNNVNILANRIFVLQQQQQQQQLPPPPNPFLFYSPPHQLFSVENKSSIPFSFNTTVHQQPLPPFVFDSKHSHRVNYLDEEEENDDDEDYEDDDDDDGSPILFNSMGNFPPREVDQHENNERILFCERAKLYHLDPSINQLKERGNGEIMILQHKITNLSRILMFHDQRLEICAHHQINPQLQLKSYENIPHAYTWSVLDFAEGEAKYETFCVKFKTDEQGRNFSKIFYESKDNFPSIERISLNEDDLIPHGQLELTTEQIERIQKNFRLLLSSDSYENKTSLKIHQNQSTNRTDSYFSSNFLPHTNQIKSIDSSFISHTPNRLIDENIESFGSPPKSQRQIIKAKRSLPSNRIPPPSVPSYEQLSPKINQIDEISNSQTHQKKSRNISANQSSSNTIDNYAVKIVENILDNVKQTLHKQKTIVNIEDDNSKSFHSGFSFINYGTKTNFQFSSKIPFTFENHPKIDFMNFTRQSSSTSNQTEEQDFSDQDSSLCDENTNDDNYEPSVSYKPIVHLEPVEVKTGEEDENILFCERAKLYRYDSSIHLFKERGIGELKILQHKINNRCRIVMRRDQIFKICANHRLNNEMELNVHTEKLNAYIWSAMDFSDGELKHETLCVKFKTSDIAERFYHEFNHAKQFK